MSILGKWFKKEQEERLEKQTRKSADVSIDDKTTQTDSDVQITKIQSQDENKEIKRKKKKIVIDDDALDEKKDSAIKALSEAPDLNVILRPHVTEKAATKEGNSVYTFVVNPKATKNEIKKAILKTYKVKPRKIRIMNMRGKNVRWGRNFGKRVNWKKAHVYLKKGDTIIIHEGT